jgi:hypothetical protein
MLHWLPRSSTFYTGGSVHKTNSQKIQGSMLYDIIKIDGGHIDSLLLFLNNIRCLENIVIWWIIDEKGLINDVT